MGSGFEGHNGTLKVIPKWSDIQALSGSTPSATTTQKIIEGLTWCLQKLNSWKASHTRRSSNSAAHSSARYAKVCNRLCNMDGDTPPIRDKLLCSLSASACPPNKCVAVAIQ
ncbi:hypothetical protein SO802_030308 [Lithocarpus litseifolius]|uniref:RNase H type-1 domain-containing protein n=1 Tax=Lithocarpus litseifolius TaxID=425828 RepID=A0AAW2BJQ2_9ROSI